MTRGGTYIHQSQKGSWSKRKGGKGTLPTLLDNFAIEEEEESNHAVIEHVDYLSELINRVGNGDEESRETFPSFPPPAMATGSEPSSMEIARFESTNRNAPNVTNTLENRPEERVGNERERGKRLELVDRIVHDRLERKRRNKGGARNGARNDTRGDARYNGEEGGALNAKNMESGASPRLSISAGESSKARPALSPPSGFIVMEEGLSATNKPAAFPRGGVGMTKRPHSKSVDLIPLYTRQTGDASDFLTNATVLRGSRPLSAAQLYPKPTISVKISGKEVDKDAGHHDDIEKPLVHMTYSTSRSLEDNRQLRRGRPHSAAEGSSRGGKATRPMMTLSRGRRSLGHRSSISVKRAQPKAHTRSLPEHVEVSTPFVALDGSLIEAVKQRVRAVPHSTLLKASAKIHERAKWVYLSILVRTQLHCWCENFASKKIALPQAHSVLLLKSRSHLYLPFLWCAT